MATCEFCIYHGSAEILWPVEPPCISPYRTPDNIHFVHTGEYVWAYIKDDDVYVSRSQFPIPKSGYVIETQATSTADCDRPALWITPNGITYIAYDRTDGSTYYKFSTDYCKTWSDETLMFTDCIHPRIAVGTNGELLKSAFKYNAGTSGPGKIRVICVSPGKDIVAETNALLWDGAANLAFDVEDSGFDITFQGGRFLLICKFDGASVLSILSSLDFGSTYKDIT